VSRTNISVLLATALLGILLWVVLSIVRDLARAPEEPIARIAEPEVINFDPALPRINNSDELIAWLNTRGMPAEQLAADYCGWLNELGYTEGPQLLGPTACLPQDSLYTEIVNSDDSSLLAIAANGNALAFQRLAERSLQSDPLAALEWYEQAVINGSVHAMIRLSDLLTTLATPGLNQFVSDPVWENALQQVASEMPAPAERALAWSVAAVIVGGYAVLDNTHAARIANLAEQLDFVSIDRACETAQDYVLESAAARRARGGAVFSTQTPPLALSVGAPAEALPCSIPVLPLVSLATCTSATVVGPGPELIRVWLCPAN
jgi:hypothetical protein